MRARTSYYHIALLLMACQLSSLSGANSYSNASSKTSMTRPLQPPYHNVKATSSFWQDIIANEDVEHSALRILGIYQKSRHPSGIDTYFTINCKKKLLFAGDDTPYYDTQTKTGTRDVRAEWFHLPSNFSGELALYPTIRQFAFIPTYQYELGHFFEHSWFDNMWLIFSMPFISIKQGLNPQQSNIQNPGTGANGNPTDILNALNQPWFPFGRMIVGECERFSPSHISVGVGTTWTTKNDFLLIYQSTIDISTCSRNNPTYIFSPVIGPNGHLAWTNEVDIELPMQPIDSCYECKIMVNMLSQYIFARSELRTFDLKGKQWSRYLPLRNIKTGNLVAGVDILTQEVRVHPRNFVNLTGGILLGSDCFSVDMGYMLWVHRGETLQFTKPNCGPAGFLIKDFYLPGSAIGKSASKSTIFQQAEDDVDFTHLYQNDINLSSGSSEQALTQSFYITMAYETKVSYAALGAWCEQPEHNGAARSWGIWATVGTSF